MVTRNIKTSLLPTTSSGGAQILLHQREVQRIQLQVLLELLATFRHVTQQVFQHCKRSAQRFLLSDISKEILDVWRQISVGLVFRGSQLEREAELQYLQHCILFDFCGGSQWQRMDMFCLQYLYRKDNPHGSGPLLKKFQDDIIFLRPFVSLAFGFIWLSLVSTDWHLKHQPTIKNVWQQHKHIFFCFVFSQIAVFISTHT